MKLCVFFIINILPWIALLGDWALRWTEGSEALQVAFVMFVFPLIMNALQYYIIDSFIKDASGGFEAVQTDEGSNRAQPSYHTIVNRDSTDSEDVEDIRTSAVKEDEAPEYGTSNEGPQRQQVGRRRSGVKEDMGKDV